MNLVELPENIIYDLCNEMDTISLANLMISHSRIYQICYDLLQKRLKIRKTQTKINISRDVFHWSTSDDEKGVYLIETEVNNVNILVIYHRIKVQNMYVRFNNINNNNRFNNNNIDDNNVRFNNEIIISKDRILTFIKFLQNLPQNNGNKIFENIIFNVDSDNNQITIHKIGNENCDIKYNLHDFSIVLTDVITFIKGRYYNLLLEIETTYES